MPSTFVKFACFFLATWLSGCSLYSNNIDDWISNNRNNNSTLSPDPSSSVQKKPNSNNLTPTPDNPHKLAPQKTSSEEYIVKPNDTLKNIALKYGTSLELLVEANLIENPNIISVGQKLTIPPPQKGTKGSAFKIIPDSELVFSPEAALFDLHAYIQKNNDYLKSYQEEVDGQMLSAEEIFREVTSDYSVNPRILLSILEYSRQKLSNSDVYPMGFRNPGYTGLYKQLVWTANQLNRGYYLWKIGGFSSWVFEDGQTIIPSNRINAGTAAVQYVFSQMVDKNSWSIDVSPDGLFATYNNLFGYPFAYSIEPLIPSGLVQPKLQLPFEKNAVWSFTGGPHAGWDSGSAWAAIDFAPPGIPLGCVLNEAWVVAMGSGMVVRADHGVVIQDLDPDIPNQSGWSLFYLHIDSEGRVKPGEYLKDGERIGHPSCEGGVSSGTHLHAARRYNGEWISADGDLPFILDGWVSEGSGIEYNGSLRKNNQLVEAWDQRKTENQIRR